MAEQAPQALLCIAGLFGRSPWAPARLGPFAAQKRLFSPTHRRRPSPTVL